MFVGHSVLDEVRQVLRAVSRRERHSILWVFGPLAPPLTGQSHVNAQIITYFARHRQVIAISTGSSVLGKLLRALWIALIGLVFVRKRDRVYISPPGQNGMWLILFLIGGLRLRKLPHWVHHHSFRAINLGPMRPVSLLCIIGGPTQRHIFLSAAMRDRFAQIYLSSLQRDNSQVLSNAFFFSGNVPTPDSMRTGPIVLGHLSNMTKEKGIPYLTGVFENLIQAGVNCRLLLAGPIADKALEAHVRQILSRYPSLAVWEGPIYGEAVNSFYKKVDLFVLASRLVDEADPIVLLEAYRHGCDVLASNTGCISERIRSPENLLGFSEIADYALFTATIDKIAEDRGVVATQCREHSQALYRSSIEDAARLFAEFGIKVSESVH